MTATYTILASGAEGLIERTVEAATADAARAIVEAEGLVVITITTRTDA